MDLKGLNEFCKKNGIKFVDIKFVDLPGTWQHFTIPLHEFDQSAVSEGLGFDGSSIRGFKEINESDMLLIPDLSTTIADPFSKDTLSVLADVVEPGSMARYSCDPRFVATKALNYLKKSGVGDEAYFGPEAEFFIFDGVRYEQTTNTGFYHIESKEGTWNSASMEGKDNNENNLGYKPRHKEGYFPVAPTDSQQEIRNEMMDVMEKCGITVEKQHHEVATAGQAEIDMRFGSLVTMADSLMMFKYIVKNVAVKNNQTATFMPKPLFNDNGSGMHVHQSIWKGGKNLFAGDKYAGLSQLGLYYIGGILEHAPALTALCSPTTNSFKRLVPGFEAPVNLVYSQRNRSAAIRIPMYSKNPKSKRIEYRSPDPSCNPYLAFSAMLMAGLDGINRKISPGEPTEVNLYDLPPEKAKKVKSLPKTLPEAVEAFKKDTKFLLEGGVFTQDILDSWIEYVTKKEEEVSKRPHPWEFMLYYDA